MYFQKDSRQQNEGRIEMKRDLLTYLKSLRNWRWVLPAIMILLTELIMVIFYPVLSSVVSVPGLMTGTFFFWIIMDYTIGIGREEKNGWKNAIGVLVCILSVIYLVLKGGII
jgi:hypothetical protein